MKRLGIMVALGGAMSLTLSIAGCGSAIAQGAQKFTGTVTIGYENAPDPESVALEQHDFQKALGVNVRLEYFESGPAALTALASGKLDFMTTLGNPPTAAAIARGVPLEVIWAMERYTTGEGLVVKNSSGIHRLSQLEGKTVALVKGSTSPFELQTALKLHHIPISRVTEINMSPTEMVSAWKTGQIQAAYVWVPFSTDMAADDGHFLMYDQDVYREAPIFNLAVVNAHWAAGHKTLVDDFIRAEQMGVSYFEQHPQKAYQDMGKINGISAAAARVQTEGFSFTTISQELEPARLGEGAGVKNSLVTKSLTSAAQWLYQTGQIPSLPRNMAQYVDPHFVESVLGKGSR